MKILGTGLQGLVGSRVVDLLSPQHTFENISRSTGVDISDKKQVFSAFEKSGADVVLHLAAKSDVDGCEKDKSLGYDGQAWRINVEGTRHIAEACEMMGKKLIYVSTDFVFDGQKEFYTEEDSPHPLNWYAQTKYEAEVIVQSLSVPWIIIRIAYPYRSAFEKVDFVRAIKNKLEKGEEIAVITDHIMTPTFIDDIANAFGVILQNEMVGGIYHIVGSEYISPYDASCSIAQEFGYDLDLIKKTTREKYFKDRAERPFRLALKNDKIRQLGIDMSTFTFGLEKVKRQL